MPSASDPGARPVVMVTGGSRGIGRETCIAAAAAGWNVAFTYQRDSRAAEDTLSAIEAAGAAGAAFQADVARPEQLDAAFDAAWARFGRLDGLVNNAGRLDPPRPLADLDAKDLLATFSVNVFGVFHATAAAARRMSTRRGGRGGAIVNLSSAAARTGGAPGEAAYVASKGAVDSFTRAMARELVPDGIRVNAVRPGLVATEMHEAHGGAAAVARFAAAIPLQRAGQPQEVAATIVFLLGPASGYIHGALVDITGGR